MLQVKHTPTSITLSDGSGNKVSVIRNDEGEIKVVSKIKHMRFTSMFNKVGEIIKHMILHPENTKDAFKTRFSKLSVKLSDRKLSSFNQI